MELELRSELGLGLVLLDFEQVIKELAELISELAGVEKQHQPKVVRPGQTRGIEDTKGTS